MIYDPQEDSYMLQKAVERFAYGRVIDMGTGSGILGMTALKRGDVESVLFCDIDKECISRVKKIVKDERAGFITSDLFENISKKEKFDCVIFNPPYLPEDELDKSLHNVGGKMGYETIVRFLEQAKEHLEDDGMILLLFSSLSKKNIIDRKLKGYYVYENIDERSFFMEKLYMYLIEKKRTFKGHRGFVETLNYRWEGKNVIAARKYSRTEFYDSAKEARILKMLNKKGIGPELYRHDKKSNAIIMEYVRGMRIIDYFVSHKKTDIIEIIEKVLNQLYIMDVMGINKQEMTNPYKHIIIRGASGKAEPVMIDFERAQKSPRPKNITQFIQFLNSGRLAHIFREKGMHVDKEKLMQIAKSYHSGQTAVRDIIRAIG